MAQPVGPKISPFSRAGDDDRWYRHIAEATSELRRDFLKMKKRQATPREFGLRVRTHPKSLLITARNKMSTGVDIEIATHELNLLGQGIESATIFSARQRNRHNLEQIERLLEKVQDMGGHAVESPRGGVLLWEQIPATAIADFLDDFLVHPLNFDFQADSIAEYLRSAISDGDKRLGAWTIALPTRGEGKVAHLRVLDQPIATRRRKVREDATRGSLLISGKSARVGGKTDVRHGLMPGSDVAADAPEAVVRAAMPRPLLLLYLLRGRLPDPNDKEGRLFRDDDPVLPALALHFPPGEGQATTPKRLVRYRLNRVAQQQLFATPDGDDDASDDLDADD